ncbi:MAG: nucleotidyltransferase domain-containing protein [Caldisericia bacterium]|nr:nucleotidyltransferase domain-containing protein [Caldisericia bacterium]
MKKEELTTREKIIVEICLSFYPDIHAIYIYGSSITEYEKKDSDIDIAVLFHYSLKIDFDKYMSMITKLSLTLHKEIDMVNLREAGVILQKEIVYKGKQIYMDNTLKAGDYEAFIMRQYQLFTEERNEIVKDGLEKGRFYNE